MFQTHVLMLVPDPTLWQVLPPEVAARCGRTIGGWCGRYLLQEEIPAKVQSRALTPGLVLGWPGLK